MLHQPPRPHVQGGDRDDGQLLVDAQLFEQARIAAFQCGNPCLVRLATAPAIAARQRPTPKQAARAALNFSPARCC
jgi:hypothetical protein